MRNDPAQVRLSAEQYLNRNWCASTLRPGSIRLRLSQR